MSSFVGMGVAAMVVFIDAVKTGPTKRSQRLSQLTTMEEEKDVGFGTVVVPLSPLMLVEAVGVGMTEGPGGEREGLSCETASTNCSKARSENLILTEKRANYGRLSGEECNVEPSIIYGVASFEGQ